jgi:hypothetical protein
MITFKQFLIEGGAATSAFHTVRATKEDIEKALDFVAKHTGIAKSTLMNNLLGSTSHTLAGKKKDSGDIDIALQEDKFDRDTIVKKMQSATGMDKVKQIGNGTFSFAVPTSKDRKVQVDLMFVASEEWAKFGFHSPIDSAYNGMVRNNMLLDNVMRHTFEPGKDLQVFDDKGNEIVRVRRVFGRGEGLYRTFKVAPMRKDGKGRTALRKSTPEEVSDVLKQLGRKDKFSHEVDPILDPNKAAEFMFGKGTTAKDLMSAEQVIKAIFKRKDHAAIFKDAVNDMRQAGVDVPLEISKFG